jgi:methionyl-tRNA formyltransferase
VTRRAHLPRVRTVFLGSGSFGIGILDALAAHPDIELVGIITAPPRPSGRKRILRPTAIDRRAREIGVPAVLTPERLRAASAISGALALEPGLAILADYGQIVPGALLDLPHGALNLHPSLLPRHRGATPIPGAILAGDTETGVTLIRMDAGLDTGPIIAREALAMAGTERAPELEANLAGLAASLLVANLGPWLRGTISATPQPTDGASLTRVLQREDGRLDPTRSSEVLERQVRAYLPWPGSFIDTIAGRIVVSEAAIGARLDAQPGELGVLGIAVAEGRTLELRVVRPAGGNEMTWPELLRGRPSLIGSRVSPAP